MGGAGVREPPGVAMRADRTAGGDRSSESEGLFAKQKWLDLMIEGRKKYEYRKDIPYWQTRLLDKPEHIEFVKFYSAYRHDTPWAIFEWIRTERIRRGAVDTAIARSSGMRIFCIYI